MEGERGGGGGGGGGVDVEARLVSTAFVTPGT